jgi:tetratricopeptide (TPR) repeat protein
MLKKREFIIIISVAISLVALNLKAQESDSINVLLEKAHKNLENRDYYGAIIYLNEAIYKNPNDITLYLDRAYTKICGKIYHGALNDLDLASMINKNIPRLYYLRGLVMKKTNRFHEAINNFDKALSLDKKYHEAFIEKVDVLILQEDFTKALNIINKGIDENLSYGDFYFTKAKVLHYMKDFEGALNCLEQAAMFGDFNNNSDFYTLQGKTAMNLNKFEDTKEMLKKSLSINNQDASAFYVRGILKYLSGNYEDAFADFNNAIVLINNEKEYLQNNYAEIADNITTDAVIKSSRDDSGTNNINIQREELIDFIFECVYAGRLKAYDVYKNKTIPVGKIKNLEEKHPRTTAAKLKFTEKWFIDKNQMQMKKQVKSIVVGYEIYNKEGFIKGYKPYFRVKLPTTVR